MMRRLKANATCQTPQWHVCFDVETTRAANLKIGEVGLQKFRLAVAALWRFREGGSSLQDFASFLDPSELWEWIARKAEGRRRLYVWAHNLGYDLNSARFWEALERGLFVLQCPDASPCNGQHDGANGSYKAREIVTQDPPTIIPLLNSCGHPLTLLDTLNWVRLPLEEIGEAVGLAKRPMPAQDAPFADWLEYCMQDVYILSRLVHRITRFVRESDLGCFRLTAPAQAMQTFRHLCPDTLPTIDDDCDRKTLERAAYHGGRCEVYFQGRVYTDGDYSARGAPGPEDETPNLPAGPVYVLDVNGCYPSVMRDNPYPRCHHRDIEAPAPRDLEDLMQCYAAVAEVWLDSPEEAWPTVCDGRLVWATGCVRTTLCGPELYRALATHYVAKVGRVQLYSQCKMFRPFVDRLWGLRQQYAQAGEDMLAGVCKVLLNSLHGKFAQRLPRWQWASDVPSPQPWGEWARIVAESGVVEEFRSICWRTQRRIPAGEDPRSFPLIAAYATSYARERMRTLRNTAGVGNVLYEDSDEIHTTSDGYTLLDWACEIDPGRLGALKLKRKVQVARYLGLKHYVHDGTEHVCGRSRKARVNADGSWEEDDFPRIDAHLAKQPPPGVMVRRRYCAPPVGSVPGVVGPDGWVAPIHLEQWR